MARKRTGDPAAPERARAKQAAARSALRKLEVTEQGKQLGPEFQKTMADIPSMRTSLTVYMDTRLLFALRTVGTAKGISVQSLMREAAELIVAKYAPAVRKGKNRGEAQPERVVRDSAAG